MADEMNVVDPCYKHYQIIEKTSPDTLRVIEKITNNHTNSLNNLGPKHDLLKGVVCTSIDAQKAAHDQWNKDIKELWDDIKDIPDTTEMSMGGSQSGGADCPKDFQKIFNYMFLFAASSSIAIMSPDIKLVTDVCMKALTLTFGTIVLPIINLLRVIFIFMLQSLVLIVKTAAGVAIQIISNFIKTVYLNIHTIASGAIGIAKVFIYRSLTYCKSFYNTVVAAMPKKIADVEDLKDDTGKLPEPTIPSTIATLKQTEVGAINKSMNEAVKHELLNPDVVINITEERDIFMDMLIKVGETNDAIRKQIDFVYNFIQTAYLLVCHATHGKLVSVLGSHYSANHAKLLLTKAILNVEVFVIHTLNAPGISMYYIKDAFLRLLKSVHSETDPLFDQGDESIDTKDESIDTKDESKLVKVINAALEKITDDNTKINEKANVNEADDAIMKLFNPSEPVANDGNKKRKLVENTEYAIIMERLEKKLQEMRDMNTTDVNLDSPSKKIIRVEGGSKKRRTKKAKKLRNKRRYSRKH